MNVSIVSMRSWLICHGYYGILLDAITPVDAFGKLYDVCRYDAYRFVKQVSLTVSQMLAIVKILAKAHDEEMLLNLLDHDYIGSHDVRSYVMS
jgi:hypothetical protein